jgi:hypothetical protein
MGAGGQKEYLHTVGRKEMWRFLKKLNKKNYHMQKLKQYMTTNPPLQKILQGIMHMEDESKQNHK